MQSLSTTVEMRVIYHQNFSLIHLLPICTITFICTLSRNHVNKYKHLATGEINGIKLEMTIFYFKPERLCEEWCRIIWSVWKIVRQNGIMFNDTHG